MSTSCIVVDYGIGNVFSVIQALKRGGADVELTSDPERIRNAERLILPGVGAFGRAADRLRTSGLDEAVLAFIQTGRPFMGICVGMQLLMSRGLEFGEHAGLGLIEGTVEKMVATDETGEAVRVPVIGWNTLTAPHATRWDNTPFKETRDDAAYYFVHSFSCRPSNPDDICATVRVGQEDVAAAVQRDNILGVQFHPERSSDSGLAFVRAFLKQ